VRVSLDYRTPLGWIPVGVTGQLAVENGFAINFVTPVITALNIHLPQLITDMIIKNTQDINPVFDLDRLKLPMDVRLTRADSSAGHIAIRGVIQLPSPHSPAATSPIQAQ